MKPTRYLKSTSEIRWFMDDELISTSLDLDKADDETECFSDRVSSIVSTWEHLLNRQSRDINDILHNDLGQVLAALRLDISLFLIQHRTDEALTDKGNYMLALTERCMQTVNGLMKDLQPVNYRQGFTLTLNDLCRDFTDRYSVRCQLSVTGNCDNLNETWKILIYRILQEALNNIALHAGATSAAVAVSLTAGGGLQFDIRDNGCGFDTAAASRSGKLGLTFMRESAFAMGGNIDISSRVNFGTTVSLHIPPVISPCCGTGKQVDR